MTWLLGLLVLLFGLNSSSGSYDDGYESAWEEDDEPPSHASSDFREGYEDGLHDRNEYDDGYYDAKYDRSPSDWYDPSYRDGYKDGLND